MKKSPTVRRGTLSDLHCWVSGARDEGSGRRRERDGRRMPGGERRSIGRRTSPDYRVDPSI